MAPAVDAARTHLISTMPRPAIQPSSRPGMTPVGDWNDFRHALNDQRNNVASDTDAFTVPNVSNHFKYPDYLVPCTSQDHVLCDPTPDNFEQEIGSPTLLHLLKELLSMNGAEYTGPSFNMSNEVNATYEQGGTLVSLIPANHIVLNPWHRFAHVYGLMPSYTR